MEKLMFKDFKPCPFCGSTDIDVKEEIIESRMGNDCPCSAIKKVWAYCKYCGAAGRKRTGDLVYKEETIALAIEGWNERSFQKEN